MTQRLHRGNVCSVVETPLIGGRLGDEKVREFLRQHGSQAGFIRKDVDEAAAEHNGMANRKRFQRAGKEHAAMDFRLDIEIVGYLDVVHNSFEDLIDIGW